MKTLILALIGLFLCSACNYYEPKGPIPFDLHESYIYGYYDIDKISILERVLFSVDEKNKIINQRGIDHIFYEGNKGKTYRVTDSITLSVSLYSYLIPSDAIDEAIQRRYAELRDELGDTSYNKELPMGTSLPIALTGMIDAIRIYANEDYVAGYSAGADVSALFTIFYEHPYAVILNNYLAPIGTYRYQYASYNVPQAVYKESLSSVDLSGKKALGADFEFLLNGAPAKTGEYSFTVEVKTADGRTLTATTRPIPITVP